MGSCRETAVRPISFIMKNKKYRSCTPLVLFLNRTCFVGLRFSLGVDRASMTPIVLQYCILWCGRIASVSFFVFGGLKIIATVQEA